MSPAGHPLSPTSSLPPLRSLTTLKGEQIFSALDNLQQLYCPVSLSRAVKSQLEHGKLHDDVLAQPVDSGYVSEDDTDIEHIDSEYDLDELRADVFERNFAIRWLTALIASAEELPLGDEDEREQAVDKASFILASFTKLTDEDDEEDAGITREFSFKLALSPDEGSLRSRESDIPQKVSIDVRLNDAPQTTTDHTDVGLQSWGASIVFSELLCASPERFGFSREALGSSPRIIELGAGTGLVSLVLDKAMPHLGMPDATLIATDYHPAVLENLQSNVRLSRARVETCPLDWSAPILEGPLNLSADVLVATDVIYAHEHAVWLRDCATRLLAPKGVFWLLMTIRPNGRFEAVIDSVEAAFRGSHPKAPDGRYLAILSMEGVEKRRGVGRGDESGYKLFRIGWA
ncbi:putative methyltransferase-domain-containing protein [Daldinia caldariorum]|uniref:putative methyltransferase-domain-containing protein n=1 Tax=Daldinia caldariorum TaxID=326644 RepID=UPI002008028B|nr:putative methyltransferase-domain-containing protein [Daldinia caldariorum]KAI1463429.1 putative methyltransferase-domain-containing protein [Daldinia caldariorum]